MRWPRHKQVSLRRWKARIRLGRLIPYQAIADRPALLKYLSDGEYMPHMDAWQRKNHGR